MTRTSTKLSFKPKQATKKFLKELKERARDVLVRRYGLDAEDRHTLQAIGDTYGITRERVRQIENAAIAAIRKSQSFEEARHIWDELRNVLLGLGGLVEERNLLNSLATDPVTQNHIHLYLVLGDEFTHHKENNQFKKRWGVDQPLTDKVHTILEELHEIIDYHELLEESDIVSRFLDHNHAADLPEEYKETLSAMRWLAISKVLGKNPLGHWGHASSPNIKTRGIRDLAYLVMRDHGSPMHFREVADAIAETFGRKVHTATCHNELIKDDRFVLIGRGLYALMEWGYRAGTAREVVEHILREEDRPMSREEIIERVMRERHLKKNTILVNLQNAKYFKRNKDGLYTLVTEE